MSADSREIKEIVVIQGDEYRAKTSGSFSKRIFFSDVYVKANRLINEITEATDAYLSQYKGESRYEHQLRGGVNNIIIFKGWRGQGKTSAMQTFAYYLKGLIQDDDKLFGQDGCYKPDKFDVLGTIDPTMMNRNESIVKVLLSRLFIAFDGKLQREGYFQGGREREEQKRDILRLFSQCYDNVNYFGNEENSNYSGSDLDSLARLGSSTELRCNLHRLISKYLDFGKKETGSNRFLVIQIDDADLSTANTYETCEQIREYLTIPNVIVLMATDFRQIRNSVYQAYITEYRDVLKLQSRVDMVDNCFQKTMKYLEKMFPHGHRISLPELKDDECLNFDYLKLVYKEKITDENNLVVFPGCDTIKDQLLRLMFERTGVVFRKNRQGMHPFLPDTLRELTHLLRIMFEDMQEVDQDKLYKYLFTKDPELKKEVDRQLEMQNANLDQLYRYFWDNWAYIRLSKKSFEILRKIVKYNSDVKSALLFIFNKYVFELELDKELSKEEREQAVTLNKSRIISKILEYAKELDRCDGYGNLEAALSIFYTIRLNEWFTEDLRDRKLERFEGFEYMPFEIQSGSGYSFDDFEVNNLEVRAGQKVWKNLLAPKDDEDPEAGKIFSVWNLMASRVRAISDPEKWQTLGLGEDDFSNTRFQDAPETDKKRKEVYGRADWSLMLNVKAIMANIDVRAFFDYWITRYVNKGYKKLESSAPMAEWEATFRDMMHIFLEWRSKEGEDKLKPYAYLETVDIFEDSDKELEDCTRKSDEIFKLVFLNNSSNSENYTEWYKAKVKGYCKKSGELVASATPDNIESVKQVIGEMISLYNSEDYGVFSTDFSTAGSQKLRDFYNKQKAINDYIVDKRKDSNLNFATFKEELLRLL